MELPLPIEPPPIGLPPDIPDIVLPDAPVLCTVGLPMLLPPIPDIPPPDTAGGVDGAEDTGEGKTEEPPAFADGAEKRFNANCSNWSSRRRFACVFLYCSLILQSWYH